MSDRLSPQSLNAAFGHLEGQALIEALVVEGPLRGRTALVSSFGAESVVLLHMVAKADPSIPVVFLDTLVHFPATLAYKAELTERLGLTDIRDAKPDMRYLARLDPEGKLFAQDPNICCHVRKVETLDEALYPFAAWITGRKRFQNSERQRLQTIEPDENSKRIKLNPLADWTAERLEAYRQAHDLPAHPLVSKGYASVGCAPCTRPVAAGEDPRAGRWSGLAKTECGIHMPKPIGERPTVEEGCLI
jgi:phosphoadenosine phosphosulfate reductase